MAAEILPKSGIYSIRNIVSGRIYVGSAVHIAQRWSAHRGRLQKGTHHSKILQRSWNKHGEAAFKFEVLEAVLDVKNLLAREQIWIDNFHAACPQRGFNRSPTAGSPLGTKHSPETRAKYSATRLGRKLPPRSDEFKSKIAAIRRGSKASDEARKKMADAHTGKKCRPRTAEHCKNISRSKCGMKRTAASRAKQSATMTGRKLPPERAAKHREMLIARNKRRAWARPGPAQLSLPL